MAAMILLFVGPPLVARWMNTGWSLWPNLLAGLIYQHNLIFRDMNPINPVTWPLEVEVQFYLVAPALAAVFSIRSSIVRRAAVFLFLVGWPIARSFLPPEWKYTQASLVWYAEYFAAGFLVADLYLIEWQQLLRRSLAWDLASIGVFAAVIMAPPGERFGSVWACLMLLACIGALRGRISSWVCRRPFLIGVGTMCYSVYLIHFRLMFITGRLAARLFAPLEARYQRSGPMPFSVRFAEDALISIPAILLVGAIFFVLLERPCMNPAWPSDAAQCLRRWMGREAVAGQG